jgi:hypothetical protein
MKKSIALVALFLASQLISQAQTIKKNSVYVELLGNGIVYSINYDRLITLNKHLKLAPRVGFEYLPQKKTYVPTYGQFHIPIEVNLLWAKRAQSKNFVEAGFGLSLFSMADKYDFSSVNGTEATGYPLSYRMARIGLFRAGFRHQKPEGGLMYRVGIMARISQDDFSDSKVSDDLFYRLWPGLSLGYSF